MPAAITALDSVWVGDAILKRQELVCGEHFDRARHGFEIVQQAGAACAEPRADLVGRDVQADVGQRGTIVHDGTGDAHRHRLDCDRLLQIDCERLEDVSEAREGRRRVAVNGQWDRARFLPLEESEQRFRTADITSEQHYRSQ